MTLISLSFSFCVSDSKHTERVVSNTKKILPTAEEAVIRAIDSLQSIVCQSLLCQVPAVPVHAGDNAASRQGQIKVQYAISVCGH